MFRCLGRTYSADCAEYDDGGDEGCEVEEGWDFAEGVVVLGGSHYWELIGDVVRLSGYSVC
jgi:hypothetical protein